MEKDDFQKNTVFIDWKSRNMSFKYNDDKIVEVRFKEAKIGGADIFYVFCGIAIIQDFYIKENKTTTWSWFDKQLWDAVCKEFRCKLTLSSLDKYWSNIRNADPTYITVLVNDASPQEPKKFSRELFGTDGGDHFLGLRQKKSGGKYKLWSVDFTHFDDMFDEFKKNVSILLDTCAIHSSPYEKNILQTVEVVYGIKGSPFELNKLVKQANKSIFIVGQNLYTLVKDEIKAAKKNVNKEGYFRKKLTSWLKESDEREVEMLICDPSSKASVLHYAIVFGEDFIIHLCDAVKRYKLWQDKMGSIGFSAKVALAAPLSIQTIDAEAEDQEKGLITITPLAFEPRPGVRPTFIIRRKDNQGIFQRYYETYHDLLVKSFVRNVTDVSTEELNKCVELVEEYRKLLDSRKKRQRNT